MKMTCSRITGGKVLTARNEKKAEPRKDPPQAFPCFIPDVWSVEKKYLKRIIGDDVAEDFII